MKTQLLALAALAVLAGAAQADGLSANVALTTKYKYRGQDQSDNTKDAVPALQGGFDWALGGLYVGNWNSSVDFEPARGLEMDFYGGFKGELGGGLSYDLGLLQYYYPGSGAHVANTTEVYGALGWSVATLKYSHVVSKDYFGLGAPFGAKGRGTGYLDLSANWPLFDKLTLNGHVGHTRLASELRDANAAYVNYVDYKLGATWDFGQGFSASGAVVGATKDGANQWGDTNKARLVLTLAKSM